MKLRNTWAIRRDLFVGYSITAVLMAIAVTIAAKFESLTLLAFAFLGVPAVCIFLMRPLILEHQEAKRRDRMQLAKDRGRMDGDLWDGLD